MSVIAQFKNICAFPTVALFLKVIEKEKLYCLSFLYVIIMLAHESTITIISFHNGSERLLGTLDVKGTIMYVYI